MKFALTILMLAVSTAMQAAPAVTPQAAAAQVRDGAAVLVDVREESELRAAGLAEPAAWIATSAIEGRTDTYKNFIAQLNPDKAVIIYCRSGRRAEAAAEHLTGLGFRTFNMGGFDDWVAAGLPVRQFTPPEPKKTLH
jgi:rhodanese-related sulfurtransferase